MACEACNVKFTLFTRKKQCTECTRYFCSECVIKRLDKMLSCDSCRVLSQRPLVQSQIAQMRGKDLRQYLLAKKVPIKGCIEKQDLIKVLLVYANGNDSFARTENAEETRTSNVSCPSFSQPEERKAECEGESREDRAREAGVVGSDLESTQEISGTDCSLNERSGLVLPQETNLSNVQCSMSNALTKATLRSDIVKLSDINTLSELDYLSVKQLKNLLSTNRVDYKGCVERHELLDKASRLWEQYKQSKTDVETLDENLCKICWDEPVECVILECGHMACCLECGKQMSECPICKQYVVRVVRVFKA